MSQNSIKWTAAFVCITFLFLFPASHHVLMDYTEAHPYIMGFFKFAALAFLGELMGNRISEGAWNKPKGAFLRMIAWGLMGMAIAFVLPFAYQGGELLQQQGLLSFTEGNLINQFAKAFTASVIFNLLPGPIVIIYHRLAESFIELCDGHISDLKHIGLSRAIASIDWVNLIQFVILRVNLIIFIPINTIIFLLPQNQRVLVAAYASILLGAVLGYYKANRKVAAR